MKNLIVLSALIWVLTGCCRKAIPVRSEKSDSVRIEKTTEYIERVRWDTVTVEIPAQSAVYTGESDSSYLETQYASSMARILDDGSLYHDLYNKPQKRPVTVPVIDRERTQARDSVVFREICTEVPVRLPLRWWEKFLACSGAAMWGLLVITGICAVLRRKFLNNL